MPPPARSQSRTPKKTQEDQIPKDKPVPRTPSTPRGSGLMGTGMHSARHWDASDEEAQRAARKNLRTAMDTAGTGTGASTPGLEKKARQEESKETPRGRSAPPGTDRAAKPKADDTENTEMEDEPPGDMTASASTTIDVNPVVNPQNLDQQIMFNIHTLNQKIQELQKNREKTEEKIETLQRMARASMVDKREKEDALTAKTYDILGIPSKDNRDNKEDFLNWILRFGRMTDMSIIGLINMGQSTRGSQTETWRILFKDFPSKKKLHEAIKNQDLEYWSSGETWKGWKVWGRWTEGAISRIIRENLNVLWKAYKEVMTETKLYAADGMEIDYRLAGIFDKKDRAPRVLIVYDESNNDPRVKIYMRPPDGHDAKEFESLVKKIFDDEESDRRQRSQGKASSSTELPKTPHELEIRTRQYRHSFRSMKELNDDYPDYFTEICAHAQRTMKKREEQGGKKGKGKGGKSKEGKGKDRDEDKGKNETQEGGASASSAWNKGTDREADKGEGNKGGKSGEKGEHEGKWWNWGWNEEGKGWNKW